MQKIRYREGYKYQLSEWYTMPTPIRPPKGEILTDWILLSEAGWLTILPGYAWDGPSGPTLDSRCAMRASLVHDALYQLIREGHLPASARKAADLLLYEMCVEDGMLPVRARLWLRAVRVFGSPAADPKSTKPIKEAP